jgi:fibronectin type 3 domain-containing protein
MRKVTLFRYWRAFSSMFILCCCSACGNSTTAPNAPTGLTVSGTALNINLSWTAAPGGVYYNIYRGTASGQEYGFSGSSTASFTDNTSAPSGTTYYYYVTTLDSDNIESGASNEVSVTVAAPTLTLASNTTSSISLSWTTPAAITGVTGYNIYRSTASGAEASPATYSSAVTSYSDTTNIVHGTKYYYRVTAIGANGESFGSNEISVTP